jgi:hypothetical protein
MRRGKKFSDIQPLLAVALRLARAWFSFLLLWEVLGAIFLRVLRFGFFAPASSGLAVCQPWFYLRLVAYGFVGLSEGHTVALETDRLNPSRILTLEPERSVAVGKSQYRSK